MSVLINMEMPKSCGECLNIGWHYVFECWLDDVEEGERLPNCPLIPVPEHGRLIDADAMTASVKTQTEFTKLLGGREMAEIACIIEENFLKEIDNAPTVIPAEEGEG